MNVTCACEPDPVKRIAGVPMDGAVLPYMFKETLHDGDAEEAYVIDPPENVTFPMPDVVDNPVVDPLI